MSPRLALHFLGPPKLELDDAPVTVDRRKTLALLAYLAVNRWEHHRDHISALLWPDYEQAKALTNVRHLLWEVQQLTGEGWVVPGREDYTRHRNKLLPKKFLREIGKQIVKQRQSKTK